ncbi:YggS family pyridoxal phosphate-dependent enzyme [Anabaena sphaerica FACHB-251]|uniref:Pyridoxal phosphate homeostasis protein n=1 Tax=Anabaena sphaerica FACHB-251 TaxID=2692883 RepID=A0A926WFC1_9NOST|nr:YggS family pyridoxal phosphate-dependent enzyme [Anabaena sphaerica]MBD2293397.1 YggS family pyridoxal phosphate-dependent enzyme [Anabaena sphaerica FACHB-251]
MTSLISERIVTIRASVPSSVRLIAVSKQVPTELMREAYAAGIRDFAESRIQEAASKQTQLQDLPDITWHFIGNLQSNKAKKALELFDWIHSVDNLHIAQRLDTLAQQLGVSPLVCLQVKILPDPHKSGWMIPDLLADLAALNQCKNLQIQGLMTIPPRGLDEGKIFNVFNDTRNLAQEIASQGWGNIKMQHLSMGMSGDYQLAIQAGATMVRLGTILFGHRFQLAKI